MPLNKETEIKYMKHSLMVRETRVQFQIKSYQRVKNGT